VYILCIFSYLILYVYSLTLLLLLQPNVPLRMNTIYLSNYLLSLSLSLTLSLSLLYVYACFCVPQIQVGVEFEASTRTQETTTSFGYQMELPEANMVFRGQFISATLSQMSR